jgi:Tfp pilus assembly protein PilE
MHRFVVALFILGCTAILACQSYTTGLQQSVKAADETAATAALHSIALAQRNYLMSTGDYGTFQQLSEGGYLDSRFNSTNPEIKGYVLTMNVTPKTEGQSQGFFSCNADPTGSLSGRHLYIDSTSNLIHVNASQPASANDAPVQLSVL